MINFLRKLILPAAIVLFCFLIGANAYVAWKNLKIIESSAAQRLDASDLQADIVAVQLDLQAIENGQHGYLLTGDDTYLVPFTQAVETLPAHLSNLRARLVNRPAQELDIEQQLESVAAGKIAEANETIQLRQKGYRHRAFVIVDSNRGKELMDKSRSLLASLTATETARITNSQQQFAGSTRKALTDAAFGSLILLAVTIVTLFAFHYRAQWLRIANDRQAKSLRATEETLHRLTSTISTSVRTTLADLEAQAETLLRVDGGFLPRVGQQRVEWMHDATRHLNRVLDEYLDPRPAADVAQIPARSSRGSGNGQADFTHSQSA